MSGPKFYAATRLKVSREGALHVILPGEPVDPTEFGRILRRHVEHGRIIRVEEDGTAKGVSLRQAKRFGIEAVPAIRAARTQNTIHKRIETRDEDGKITHVEYRQISGPGAVAHSGSEAHGGREGTSAGDRPPTADEPSRRRRQEPEATEESDDPDEPDTDGDGDDAVEE